MSYAVTPWSMKRIRHLFRERNEKGHPKEEPLAATQHAGVVPKTALEFKTMEAVTSDLALFKLVNPGDFVISLRSFEGGLEYSAYRGLLSPAYTVLTPTPEVHAGFFRHLLKSNDFVQSLARHKKGIRDGQAVPFATLQDDYLAVPDLQTQERIANFLDEQTARIDALIAEKEALIARLQEWRQAWLSAELFQEAKYRETRLKFCLRGSLQYGATESGDPSAAGPRYIRITDIRMDGTLTDEDAKYLTEEQATSYLLEDEDVLFARSGATVGKSFVYLKEMGRCAYAGYLIRAKLDKTLLLPRYLRLLTETHQYRAYLRGAETQSTIQNASAEKYANFAFPLPPVSVQKEVVDRLDVQLNKVEHLVSHAIAHTKRLSEYRSSLISAAVTGQLDLSTFKAVA